MKLTDYIVHVLLIILLIISMSGIPIWIQTIILFYTGWRFFVLAAGGFGCTHCWIRFITAFMLLAFVAIQLPLQFYIAAFGMIAIDMATQGMKKDHKYDII